MPSPDSAIQPAWHRRWMAPAYGLLVGLGGLFSWLHRSLATPSAPVVGGVLAFAALSSAVQRASFYASAPAAHSLSGLIDVAALLALGPLGGAAAAWLGGLAYLVASAAYRRRWSARELLVVPLFHGGLRALAVSGAGAVMLQLLPEAEGGIAWLALDAHSLAGAAVACVAWFTLDRAGWVLFDLLDGGFQQLRAYARASAGTTWLVELLPLPLSVLVAAVYTGLAWPAFGLLALAILAGAILVQRWAEARSELTQRVAELTLVENVGRTIAMAEPDVEALCQLVYEEVSRIVDSTLFHLGLFEGDGYTLKLWMQEGQRQPGRTVALTPGVGLVSWLRTTRQPLLVRDLEAELATLPAQPAYLSERPPRSAVFVPLMAGEVVIGTLSAQSYLRAAYAPSDLRFLSAVANQAAVAIQRARSSEQERMRARQLDAIGQVARQVSATLEIEELFQQSVRLIRESFGYYHVGIFSVDHRLRQLSFQASASAGQPAVAVEVQWGEGLIGWVAERAQPALANDVAHDERYRCIDALEETRSELAVPLCLDDELVGVLDVQSDRLAAFGEDDLFILETLGAQIAAAIGEARLYDAERQQAWLSTALLQVSDALSHLSHMGEVLETLVRLAPMLAGVDRCSILLYDGPTARFIPAQSHGLAPDMRQQFERMVFPLGTLPLLDQIHQERVPLLISASHNADLLPLSFAETFKVREMVALPLVAQDELLGAMLVDRGPGSPGTSEGTRTGGPGRSTGARARLSSWFDDRMMTLLTGMSNQAATVIQSARLLQAQQEEAYTSLALLQVNQAVSHSAELGEALASIVRITPMLVGVQACSLFLWDEASERYQPYQQYGLPKEVLPRFWETCFTREDTPLRDLIAGRPYVTAQDLAVLDDAALVLSRGSLVLLPVATRGDVVGVMGLDCTSPLPQLGERRLSILQGIAGQAALAMENDRLLREAAEQERMKHELEVARRIQASFLPECCPEMPGWELAALWRSAREVAGDFYDFIPVRRPQDPARLGVAVADVADKGVPAALFMALSRTLLRTMAIAGRPPAETAAQANNLILADARAELFVTLVYAILEPDSGRVAYVNAGHLPPLLVRASQDAVEELRTGNMAMGVLPNLDYVEHTVHLEPGDALVLYTDGVTDATGSGDQVFGRKRLTEVARSGRHESASALAARIEAAVTEFSGDAPQVDDMTLVIAKRKSRA